MINLVNHPRNKSSISKPLKKMLIFKVLVFKDIALVPVTNPVQNNDYTVNMPNDPAHVEVEFRGA